MDIEEHGNFFLERRRVEKEDGTTHEYFLVGTVVELEALKHYNVANQVGFETGDQAMAWIESQAAS